jgi:hypothetical protein
MTCFNRKFPARPSKGSSEAGSLDAIARTAICYNGEGWLRFGTGVCECVERGDSLRGLVRLEEGKRYLEIRWGVFEENVIWDSRVDESSSKDNKRYQKNYNPKTLRNNTGSTVPRKQLYAGRERSEDQLREREERKRKHTQPLSSKHIRRSRRPARSRSAGLPTEQ